MKIHYQDIIKNIALITIGVALFSFSVNWIIIPNHLGEGGITGVSLLLKYTLGIEPGVTNLVANTMLLALGWKFLEKETLFYTLYVVVSLSFFLGVITPTPFLPENQFAAAILAGLLTGVGSGLIILAQGTTAGGDIIAKLLQKYLGVNYSFTVLVIDILVITSTSFVIGVENTVISLVMVFIFSQALQFVTEGLNPKKSVMIISAKYNDIADDITKEVNRGITVLNGYGHFTKSEKEILYIVVSRRQVHRIQKIAHKYDENAFITVSDVQQVLGEGFTYFLDRVTNERLRK